MSAHPSQAKFSAALPPHIRISSGASTRRLPIVLDFDFEPGQVRIVTCDEMGRPIDLDARSYVWHVWAGARNFPMTADEETRSIAELRAIAASQPSPRRRPQLDDPSDRRGYLTAVLNVLRSGADWPAVFDLCPGLLASELVAEYDRAAGLLAAGRAAWDAIAANPSTETIEEHGPAASRVAGSTLRMIARATTDSVRAELVAERRAAELDATIRVVRLERLLKVLRRSPSNRALAIEVGRIMYDPYGTCLWSDPSFVPSRVGQLTPARVKELLAEDMS